MLYDQNGVHFVLYEFEIVENVVLLLEVGMLNSRNVEALLDVCKLDIRNVLRIGILDDQNFVAILGAGMLDHQNVVVRLRVFVYQPLNSKR